MDSIPSRCFTVFILIITAGILRCLEASVKNINGAKLQKLADSGTKSAKRVISLTENQAKFYNAIRVITVLVEVITITLSAQLLPYMFLDLTSFAVRTAIGIAVLTAIILVFGVYIPKRFADLFPDNIVLKTSGFLKFLYYIGLPISVILTFIANLFLLIFGIKPNDTEEEVTEEEIRLMVDIGSESGAIDPEEKEMIHNIFELDDTAVKDIMTHRTDTELLWLDEKDKWADSVSASNHSIYPVCEDSIDNIVGILYSKDFYRTLLTNGDVTKILRNPYFVPETIKADDLFRQMQQTKTHFAVVLDEYGGLGGIITMSDLLEEIVGTLSNEYDDEEDDDILRIDETTWKISGSCDIDLVCETLQVELPIEEYNTFAGMILGVLGEIPEDGSTPELEAFGLQIRVTQIFEHRIEWTIVSVLEKVQDKK